MHNNFLYSDTSGFLEISVYAVFPSTRCTRRTANSIGPALALLETGRSQKAHKGDLS